VAFAVSADAAVVVKRCANPVYLDWLRREHRTLRALAGTELPIPRFVAYAEAEVSGVTVGWLLMSRLVGRPLLGVVAEASEDGRRLLFQGLGGVLRRLHATLVPTCLPGRGDWMARQLAEARANLSWCDGTAAGLAELERSRPSAVQDRLIHGDLALDNVLVDPRGEMSLIDWADGGLGDPRHDIALALQTKPEFELTAAVLESFYAGYGSAPLDDETLDWFVRLYDFF
jgi:aminoglycoside phosphotransferase (APT) family kinase protein